MYLRAHLPYYIKLIRLDKPIGILLLLWPTWWALWLASRGSPDLNLFCIFTAGTFLMRSCGCVLNDIADRHLDGHVERTKDRPLAAGLVSVREALAVALIFSSLALLLVLTCNLLTICLAFIGALLAVLYPFLKRVTHLPQLGLGVAFSWGVPMAFAAVVGHLDWRAWFLFAAALFWPVIYDTMYAMVDREDDLKVGIKSTAILFGQWDRAIIGLLQYVFIVMLIYTGQIFHLHAGYYYCLAIAAFFFLYQQWLIKDRERADCFAAFQNNNAVGLAIFIGILWGLG